MVGRDAELAALRQALEEASAGRPNAVLIAGEAGVGKSRLLSEFTEAAAADRATVLTGGCVELGDGTLPYLPFVELFRASREKRAVEGLIDAPLAALEGAGPIDLAERDVSRIRSFGTVLDAVAGMAAHLPLVLVIEDAHWIDEASRALLAFLVAGLRSERVLIAISYRPEDLDPRTQLRSWISEVMRRGNVERLDLRPLDPDQISTLIERIRGPSTPAPLLTRVSALSEGNPFFAEELLAVVEDDERALPLSLTEVIRARVSLPDDDSATVLRVAAVIGRTAPHAVLAGVTRMEDRRLDDALRAPLERRILVPAEDDQSYSFRHALIQQVLYRDLLPSERVRIHSEVAAILSDRRDLGFSDASVAELAHHWHRAHDFERALDASITAAGEAENAHAFGSARRHLEHAIELWPRVRQEARPKGWSAARLRMRAADNAVLIGEQEHGVRLARQALEHPEDQSPAAIHERLGWYQLSLGRDEAALAHASKAIELTTADPSPEAARILASLGLELMLLGRYEESKRACERAIEVARACGEIGEEGRALNPLGVDEAMLGDPDRGIELLRRSADIAERAGRPDDHCRAHVNLADVLENNGLIEDALDVAQRGIEIARSVGLERSRGVMLGCERDSLLLRLGRWSEIAVSEGSAASPIEGWVAAYNRATAAKVAMAKGDLTSARALVDEARTQVGDTHSEVRMEMDLVDAEISLWEGRPEVALRLTASAALATPFPQQGPMLGAAMRAWADIEERRSNPIRAMPDGAGRDEILARARALEETTYPKGNRAARSLCEAEYSRSERRSDPDAWRDAVDDFRAPPDAYMAIYCRWRLAEAMLTTSSRADATEELLGAYAEAEALGAAPIVRELEALARRARIPLSGGGEPPEEKTAPGSHLGLTTRELEVLGYLASGHTNREIASALFISTKTAGTHVSNILSKLGVTNRVEAAAIAHRLGIGDLERQN